MLTKSLSKLNSKQIFNINPANNHRSMLQRYQSYEMEIEGISLKKASRAPATVPE